MKNRDSTQHVQGRSLFLDDIPQPDNLLHAAVYVSPIAHGKIKKLNIEQAQEVKGVEKIFTFRDVPAENQVGGIIQDEPLLAEKEVHFIGQPIALVIAESKKQAKQAIEQIEIEIEALPIITDPREAFQKGDLIAPPRTFTLGDVDKAWANCDVIVEGKVESGSQEHFYLEPQGAMALPAEAGGIKLYSSTQSPCGVQRIVSRVLGLSMHQVEVDVGRLGGGFGGKEDQATPWAAMAAMATLILRKPVKLVLDRKEDISYTGKRHPYTSDFKIGLTADGQIQAYDVTFYQNAGAAADLSTAILERTLFHTTNSYYIPNVRAKAISCKTNLPPFTAFRGFGAPQAMFVMEAAIRKAAERMNLTPYQIQETNLLKEKDKLPYGMQVENSRAKLCWETAKEKYQLKNKVEEVQKFNKKNKILKKGIALMPICFGISFTNKILNQAGALVHVYTDGSVSVSTGAIEMGQGVNAKIQEIVARTFSIESHRVKVESTNTTRVANTSPTAASTGADMNGKAAEIASQMILERLKGVAAKQLDQKDTKEIEIKDELVYRKGKETSLKWEKLISEAYVKRTNLSAQAYYATPDIHFDRTKEKGKPFSYHVFGTSITEATLDCLRGTYHIDSVQIVHDVGKSLNPIIDRGQVEGALLQGIGWLTMEELIFNKEGQLLTNTSSTYKVPDIKSVPSKVEVHFLENNENPYAVMGSKAIGEPPFMYGIGAYFAIINAMKAFSAQKEVEIHAPITPESVLMSIYQ